MIQPPTMRVAKICGQEKEVRRKQQKAQKTKKEAKTPVFLCGQCMSMISEQPQRYQEESVGCDLCPLWFHKACVGIQEHSMLPEKWYCEECNKYKQ